MLVLPERERTKKGAIGVETKGVTCKIPLDLHNQISEEIRETESTMSKFIEMIIREHYEKGANRIMEKGRTLAFQVSEELFQRVTSGYVHGNVHISGNAKIFANAVTGGTPVIMEKASVYGELGGEIEVHEHAVILPGVVIDNPTIDVLHIRPDEIVVERKFKRESPVITPPPEYQPHPRASKKRSRGEER